MDLLSYFRVLRRRWILILVCVVAGAAIGAASTVLDKGPSKSRTYYKATHTLIFDNSGSSAVAPTVSNLDQIAILVTTGDVPNRVAKDLGGTEIGRQLAEQITTLTNGTTNTIDITATDPSPKHAVLLANTFAKEIDASLLARDTKKYNTTRDDLQKQLDDLQNQANGFLAQISTNPLAPNADTLRKQYDATENQYYSVYGNLQQLTSTGPPTSRLSTLEGAQAIPINQSEYQARINLGDLGQNHLRADASGNANTTALTTSNDSLFKGKTSRGILGAIIGFLVGIGLALVADRLDHRIRTRSEAELAYNLPVLAEVPKFTRAQSRDDELIAFSAPMSRASEAYRAIRTSLLFQQSSGLGAPRAPDAFPIDDEMFEPEQRAPLVVMVTSAAPREGKTTTSANLATVFAEAGASVLVVNCDFRRPTIHRRFGVDDEPRRVQDTPVQNLKVVTNVLGDPNANPAQMVAAQRQAIAAARSRFDVIVLDTAPLLTANDAIEAVGVADLVLVVARCELTTTDYAERAMDILTRLEAPLGGLVLVATPDMPSDYYYYYQRGKRAQGRSGVARNGDGTNNGNGAAGTDATPADGGLFPGRSDTPPSEAAPR